MERKYYVIRLYSSVKPLVIEQFPYTEQGKKVGIVFSGLVIRIARFLYLW